MSKEFTKEEIIQNKKDAIKKLNHMLEGYINDPSGERLKKANLISFWIKEYVRMIHFEDKFVPTKNIAYKRGNIVKINFGFNIGAEYGGLHYGIVLDNKNAHNSPVVTVIPLTSIKDTKELHSNNVELGNEIYRSLKLKYDTISKSLQEEQQEIADAKKVHTALLDLIEEALKNFDTVPELSEKKKELDQAKKYFEAAQKIGDTWDQKEQHNKEQLEYLDKIGQEISRMKEGSIALVNQITTVSKIRIFDPRTLRGVLAGISLSEENMEKINQKVKELYVFK